MISRLVTACFMSSSQYRGTSVLCSDWLCPQSSLIGPSGGRGPSNCEPKAYVWSFETNRLIIYGSHVWVSLLSSCGFICLTLSAQPAAKELNFPHYIWNKENCGPATQFSFLSFYSAIDESCCAIFVKKFNVVEIGERISDQIDRNNRHISEISNIFFNTKNV